MNETEDIRLSAEYYTSQVYITPKQRILDRCDEPRHFVPILMRIWFSVENIFRNISFSQFDEVIFIPPHAVISLYMFLYVVFLLAVFLVNAKDRITGGAS